MNKRIALSPFAFEKEVGRKPLLLIRYITGSNGSDCNNIPPA
jgi:hypothetical protein